MTIELTSEIKDIKDWAVADLWLQRHGWGTGLIEQQKQLWEAANTPKPAEPVVAKTEPAKPVVAKTETSSNKSK